MSAFELFDLPPALDLAAYDRARVTIIERLSAHADVLAVFGFGEVRAPGVSDLDFLVVTNDQLTYPLSEAFAADDADIRATIRHPPFVIPVSVWPDYSNIFFVNGATCLFQRADIAPPHVPSPASASLILCDLVTWFYPDVFLAPLLTRRIPVRLALQFLNALRHANALFEIASGAAMCRVTALTRRVDDLRERIRAAPGDAASDLFADDLARALDAAAEATRAMAIELARVLRDRYDVRAAAPTAPVVVEETGIVYVDLPGDDLPRRRERAFTEAIFRETGRLYRAMPLALSFSISRVARGGGPASIAARRRAPDYPIAGSDTIERGASVRTAAMNAHTRFHLREAVGVPMVHDYHRFRGSALAGGGSLAASRARELVASMSGAPRLLVPERLAHNRNAASIDAVIEPLAASTSHAPLALVVAADDDDATPGVAFEWYGANEACIERAVTRAIDANASAPALVHFFNVHNHFHELAARRGRNDAALFRVPFSGTVHQPVSILESLPGAADNLRALDAAVVVSQTQFEYVRERVSGPVECIPLAIDPRAADRVPASTKRKPPHVVFVGQWLRDFEATRAIIARLRREGLRVSIVLPPWRRAPVADTGAAIVSGVSETYLYYLLKSATCAVFPLLHATANAAILEAAVAGTPIVATDVGGVREYLNDDTARLLASPSIDDYLDAVFETARHPDKATAMALRASEHVRKNFDARKISAMYDAYFTRVEASFGAPRFGARGAGA
ncbi:glycosyltransferase [bacterium]|nr:glycosyltransferase [bacterium]